MKETTPAAMPPCFERWCQRFDDLFSHKAQKREFRHYVGGLLGESERKNLSQMAENAVEVSYHRLHHFLTEAPWSSERVNERRLEIMNKCSQTRIRLDELAQSLPPEAFTKIKLNLAQPKTLWVVTREIEISQLVGKRNIAIVMNAETFCQASDIDYFITNIDSSIVTPQWIVDTYSSRNWVEVFYREAKGWLGLKEYQVREKRSLMRHFILVFCAYTFILWHQMTGGLRRRWANKPLNTFTEALEAFRTAMSFRFFDWLTLNRDVFAAYKASLGFIWA